MNENYIVETINLEKKYMMEKTSVSAVSGINLRFQSSSFVGIVGRSGSGKSTLLNLLGGLDTPTSGDVIVEGEKLGKKSSDELAKYRQKSVGFVFQSFNLIPTMTALENVQLPLAFAPRNDGFERAENVLKQVGLSERLNHKPSELSGGEQQRVAMARALINEPAILLADEPTGNLDSKTARELLELMKRMNSEKKQTIIMVTHEKGFAFEYCERVIELSDGSVISDEFVGSEKG